MTIARRLGFLGTAIMFGVALAVIGLTPTVLAQSQSSDAELSGWPEFSGIELTKISKYKYKANVYHSVSQTTVTATVNHSGASYVVKLGGVEDDDRVISLAVGSNVITIEVTAEDGQTTRTYTITVNRASASDLTTGELSTDLPPLNFRVIKLSTNQAILLYKVPENRGIFGRQTERYKHDGEDFVSLGSGPRFTSDTDMGGSSSFIGTGASVMSGALYKYTLRLSDSEGSIVIESSVIVRIPRYSIFSSSSNAAQADATLSNLTLTGAEDFLNESSTNSSFWREDQGYKATVPNSVSETTVTPTLNQSDASYVIKIGGVTDSDGTVQLAEGVNIITIKVTAADETYFRLYTLTVKRGFANTPATGAPTITGTAQVGQTLTASTAGISDADGWDNVTYSYQWLADDAEIDGATSSTYTLQSSDNGKVIKVRVTFTDDRGFSESLTSAGTSAVVLGGL